MSLWQSYKIKYGIVGKHITVFSITALYFTVCALTGITCPILYFSGIPCPTCGVTRAITALINLDIKGYFEYNPTAVFVIPAVWLCIHKKLFKQRLFIDIVIAAVLILNFAVYVYRLPTRYF